MHANKSFSTFQFWLDLQIAGRKKRKMLYYSRVKGKSKAAARLAQLVKRQSAEREVAGSNPGGTNTAFVVTSTNG